MGSGKKQFSDPIMVEVAGKKFEIIDLADAGDLLLHSWPTDSVRRRTAMKAIMLALRDQCDIALARKAFTAAAVEIFALRQA